MPLVELARFGPRMQKSGFLLSSNVWESDTLMLIPKPHHTQPQLPPPWGPAWDMEGAGLHTTLAVFFVFFFTLNI